MVILGVNTFLRRFYYTTYQQLSTTLDNINNSMYLRISGPYFQRTSRRYAIFFLAYFLVVTVPVLLFSRLPQKQNTPTSSIPQVGEYVYRPGRFLNGRQPNEYVSYCEFNYGLPHSMIWDSIHVDTPPELGSNSPYKVIYNAITGTAYAHLGKNDAVTYVTQATPEYLYHIVEIARYWDGPISLAVFVPDFDLDITMQLMNHLCHCFEAMSKVSLHLFYPTLHPPKFRLRKNKTEVSTTPTTTLQVLKKTVKAFREKKSNYSEYYIKWVWKASTKKTTRVGFDPPNLTFEDCGGLESFDIPTFRKQNSLVYFINVGRNVARNASTTNYFIMSDIEMVPSDGLAPKFLAMVRKLMGDKKRDEGFVFAKTVFVVPLFEVKRGEEIPRDKQTLVQMVEKNRAGYFHRNFCPQCQKFPGLSTWLASPASDIVEPLVYGKREYPYHRWEPLYFGTNNEPWYNEMLSWEGEQDKMIQMLEMCLQGYEMVILDGGFLCHAAAPRRSIKGQAQLANFRRYRNIVRALAMKYAEKPECSVDAFLPSNWRDYQPVKVKKKMYMIESTLKAIPLSTTQ